MFKLLEKPSLVFAILAILLFVPFLGGVHLFDWDEMNFAEISREMIVLGDYSRVHIDYQAFYEKPPLFFWLQVLAMKVFGVNEFAARLPNAIAGIITLVLLFNFGKKLHSKRFGILWAASYGGSLLPFLYFKSGIIDPWFNLFIFLGIWFFVLSNWKKNSNDPFPATGNFWQYLLLGGLFIGLGILTKGPVALLLAGLTIVIYLGMKMKDKAGLYAPPGQPSTHAFEGGSPLLGAGGVLRYLTALMIFSLVALLIMLAWFGIETYKNGSEFVTEFLKYQWRLFSTPDAGHKGFPGYHLVVILFGCFPASIFAFRAFFKMPRLEMPEHMLEFKRWMSILFWVVIVVFSIVQSKIVHYSSLCYFPLTFLAAWSLYALMANKLSISVWMKRGLIFIAGIFILTTLVAPFLGQRIEIIQELVKSDPWAVGKLQAEVVWTGWEVLPGIILLGFLITGFHYFKKEHPFRGYVSLLVGTVLFAYSTLYFYIGNIENYAQGALIEFYKSKAEEDCYIRTIGFKAYGHLFYAKKRKPSHPKSYDKDWQMFGEVDKPAYFIYKNHRAHEAEELGTLEEVGRKNGFAFFRRKNE